jgi:uncharacterized protein involved in high-affinity Fe2+ transport
MSFITQGKRRSPRIGFLLAGEGVYELALSYSQDQKMRTYFKEHFILDPQDESIEWYVDEETGVSYTWNFKINNRKHYIKLYKSTGEIIGG